MLYDLMGGIRMNLEFACKRPDRRKCLAGLEFATDERFLRSKHKLVEDGFARTKVKLEQRHMRTVTHMTVFVKNFRYCFARIRYWLGEQSARLDLRGYPATNEAGLELKAGSDLAEVFGEASHDFLAVRFVLYAVDAGRYF